jgi:hypothetical protein
MLFRRTIQAADIANARLNNQFVLNGTDPELVLDADDVIFIEQIIPVSSTYVINDAAGTALTGAVPSGLNLDCGPMRIDGGGFSVTGAIAIVKGFYVKMGK